MNRKTICDFGRKLTLGAHVIAALLGTDSKSLITSKRESVQVTLEGFLGDRHSGFTRLSDGRTPHYPRGTEILNDRQVSILSAEELMEVSTKMDLPQLFAEWLGANLLLGGIPHLTRLPPNTRLIFPQGTVLVVRGENLPCRWTGKVIAAQTSRPEMESIFPAASLHLRGVVACVERPGFVSEGDSIRVEVPQQTLYQPNPIEKGDRSN